MRTLIKDTMMLGSHARIARWIALAAALFVSLGARADFTDLWWNPSESGWGVNVVQSNTFMFLTFFIYGADDQPTWYTAALNRNPNGTFSGGLYRTEGTYYAVPWNPADSLPPQQVGSVQFAPSAANNYQATLTYVVDGVGAVTKSIERQTLTLIPLGGSYIGGMSASQTSCNNSSNNGAFKGTYELLVSQTGAGVATFTFSYPTYACTMSGTLEQHGGQYTIGGASYRCTQGNTVVFSGSADMSEIKATAQGIEGRWTAATGGGCRENAQFSAALI